MTEEGVGRRRCIVSGRGLIHTCLGRRSLGFTQSCREPRSSSRNYSSRTSIYTLLQGQTLLLLFYFYFYLSVSCAKQRKKTSSFVDKFLWIENVTSDQWVCQERSPRIRGSKCIGNLAIMVVVVMLSEYEQQRDLGRFNSYHPRSLKTLIHFTIWCTDVTWIY